MNFNLKKARLSQDPPLSAWRLARRIGITPQRLSDIELGKTEPNINLQRRIAHVLGVRRCEIFPNTGLKEVTHEKSDKPRL